MNRRDRSVTVRLTLREYVALYNYAEAYDVPVAQCVRVAVFPEIPAKFWPRQQPEIEGQLTLVEDVA